MPSDLRSILPFAAALLFFALVEKLTTDSLIGISPALVGLRSEVECAARSDAKVLLTGESGVGKDIAARVIHQRSARSHRPFVTINCVSVPDSLPGPKLATHTR